MDYITGYLTIEEFADRIRVGRTTVYNLIRLGLPVRHIGKRKQRIVCPDADAWLKARDVQQATEKKRKTKRRQ